MIEHPGLFFGFFSGILAVIIDGIAKRFRAKRLIISFSGAMLFSVMSFAMSVSYINTGTPICFEHSLFCLFLSLLGFLFSVDMVVVGDKRQFLFVFVAVLLSLSNIVFQALQMVE